MLAGLLWASFRVPLGERTFAEHIDRIGQTPQARDLVDGARSTVNPVIEEATDRVLGEYVEAPTHVEAGALDETSTPKKTGAYADTAAHADGLSSQERRRSRLPRADSGS